MTTTPLWVGLFTPPLVFKEKVSSQFYLGVLIAIFGGLIIAFLKDDLSIGIDGETSFLGLFFGFIWRLDGICLLYYTGKTKQFDPFQIVCNDRIRFFKPCIGYLYAN